MRLTFAAPPIQPRPIHRKRPRTLTTPTRAPTNPLAVRHVARICHACLPTERAASKSLNIEIITLALPALGALALDPLLSLIDTAFVGRIGVQPLAGVGLSTLVLNISFSIFNFLSISTTPLLAQALHSPDTDAPSRVLSASLIVACTLGTLSAALLLNYPHRILAALGATPDALPFAVDYLRARAYASPLALMSFVCNGALRALRDLQTPFFIALAANFLNILLDVLFIFRLSLGVTGAALATTISQILAAIVMIVVLIRRNHLHLRDLCRVPAITEMKPLLSAGFLLSIRTLSLLATVAYATATAAALGAVRLAAYELCRQLWVFHATILDAFAASAQALVASAVAAGNRLDARRIADRTLLLSALAGAVLGLAAVLAGKSLPGLFTPDVKVRRIATSCIAMAAVCAPLNGAVFALDGILAACADFEYMAAAIAAAAFTACLAISAVRYFAGGVVAIWGGLNVLMIARALVLGVRYVSSRSPIARKDQSR